MADQRIREFERFERMRAARGLCVGLGIAAWTIAFTLLPIGLGSPKDLTSSVIPVLATTWSFGWMILPLVIIGAGLFIAALILNERIDN